MHGAKPHKGLLEACSVCSLINPDLASLLLSLLFDLNLVNPRASTKDNFFALASVVMSLIIF